MNDMRVSLKDGRTLAYADLGRPDGRCVFFFHGAPMSRLHLAPFETTFAEHGVRVIAPDRPGYGGSSPQRGRSINDWPADIAALADALHVERFLVASHSSGGPYAVVCAALIPERVSGAVVVAGVTDMAWPPAWAGYLEGRPEIPMMRLPDEEDVMSACVERFGADGGGFLTEPFTLPAPDEAMLADEVFARGLDAAVGEAFAQGARGYAQDVYLEGRGWPFEPGRITVRVDVIHGDADTLVPVAHSRHTADVIPGATFRLLPGHGHFTILEALPSLAAARLRGAPR